MLRSEEKGQQGSFWGTRESKAEQKEIQKIHPQQAAARGQYLSSHSDPSHLNGLANLSASPQPEKDCDIHKEILRENSKGCQTLSKGKAKRKTAPEDGRAKN